MKKKKTNRKKAKPLNAGKKKVIRTSQAPPGKTSPPPGRRQDTLRAILVGKRRDLLREIKDHLSKYLQSDLPSRKNEVLDSGDLATQDVSGDMSLSFQDRRTKDLKSIDEALQRLEDNTYGICDECGADIPESRLKALPFALYCVPCREHQELLEKIAREEDRFK